TISAKSADFWAKSAKQDAKSFSGLSDVTEAFEVVAGGLRVLRPGQSATLPSLPTREQKTENRRQCLLSLFYFFPLSSSSSARAVSDWRCRSRHRRRGRRRCRWAASSGRRRRRG